MEGGFGVVDDQIVNFFVSRVGGDGVGSMSGGVFTFAFVH